MLLLFEQYLPGKKMGYGDSEWQFTNIEMKHNFVYKSLLFDLI